MKEIDLPQLKKIEVEMLDFLHGFCEEHDITYYLDSGTLLGAVRHKGFIPWDDDIDLVLTRADYTKLIKALDKEKGRYRILSSDTAPNYSYPFAKVVDTHTILKEQEALDIDGLGVYIDLFPLDHLPEGKTRRWFFHERLYYTKLFWGASVIHNPEWVQKSLKNRIIFWYAKKRGWKHWIQKIDKIVATEKYLSSSYMANLVGSCARHRCVECSVFEKKQIMEFEGHSYFGPVGYDKYLTNLYGNYMELPPKEERVTHHNFKAFYKSDVSAAENV